VQTTQQVLGCTYAWTPSEWGTPTPACGASIRSRTVSCLRSDGTPADPSACTGARPATSEAAASYATCSYAWNVSQWAGAGGCGDTVTQSRTVSCLRSDGAGVADGSCTATKPAATQTISDYSACSYSWRTVNGAWSSTCSASATRTNQVTCVRSNGEVVDDSYCADPRPATAETKGIYTSCTYASTYSATYGTCQANSAGSTSGRQSAPLTRCVRSDGTDVTSENASNRYVYCAAEMARDCSISYTYAGQYGSYNACAPSSQGSTSGTQSAPVALCVENGSNGSSRNVDTSLCTPQAQSRSCTMTYSATYSAQYGTCANDTQSAPITSCTATGNDGQTRSVSNANCPSQTTSRSCVEPTAGTCQFAARTFVYPKNGTLPTAVKISATSQADATAQAKKICESTVGIVACMVSYGTRQSSVYPFKQPYELYSGTDYAAHTGGACKSN
jgi:hypothetical protein